VLTGPISGINALRADSHAQLHQLVSDLGQVLCVGLGPAASYQIHIERVAQIPKADVFEVLGGSEAVPGPQPNLEERHVTAAVPSDARELLIAAADHDSGAVFVAEAMQGVSISVGEREFTTMGNVRSEAKWRRAIRDVEQLGLVENRGGDGSLLSVTDEGFRVADSYLS
jgi:hypothetical protein